MTAMKKKSAAKAKKPMTKQPQHHRASPTEAIAEAVGIPQPTFSNSDIKSAVKATIDAIDAKIVEHGLAPPRPLPDPPQPVEHYGLSDGQINYIASLTNDIGAHHDPVFEYVSTERRDNYLDIVIRAAHVTGVRGGTQAVKSGDLTDAARFEDLVRRTVADAAGRLKVDL